MNSYRKFLQKGIDLAGLGFEGSRENAAYFCTPKGANIIGWAGVDGIHYCFIRGFGEMLFAVSPMNAAPDYVHPLARSFGDFLRLLLACGDCAALEQAWQWDEGQFLEFLRENPPTPEQREILAAIRERMGLAPMEQPWRYLHDLQSSFDYGKLKYTEDFYDPDMNAHAPQPAPEWKVCFEKGFSPWPGRGKGGMELPLNIEFSWAGRKWLAPAAYVCSKGLVLDICMRIPAEDIRAFMKKWNLTPENESEQKFTQEQQMQLEAENPMNLDFHTALCCNGREMLEACSYGDGYNPCVPAGYVHDESAMQIMGHYGLDPEQGWMFRRCNYPWATARKPEIRNLSLRMEQELVNIPGPRFRVAAPGMQIPFSFPDRGEHILTVLECEQQELPNVRLGDEKWEYPTHVWLMRYIVQPELPHGAVQILDCDAGDSPRRKQPAGDARAPICSACIGVIGGADGPTVCCFGGAAEKRVQTAYSAMRFEPVQDVQWRMVFRRKNFEGLSIDLLQK